MIFVNSVSGSVIPDMRYAIWYRRYFWFDIVDIANSNIINNKPKPILILPMKCLYMYGIHTEFHLWNIRINYKTLNRYIQLARQQNNITKIE